MSVTLRKKFVNKPDEVVHDALKGLVAADQQVQFHPSNPRVILRSDYQHLKSDGRVTLVAGGGSGHEPFAAGYVGENAITAAVCGDIFASPPSTHVSDAVEAINGKGGTLIYVINYTGDRLHFGMAAERLKSSRSDVQIDLIYIDDDVALEAKTDGEVTTGRRGLAGAALTLQIAGVLAEKCGSNYETVRTVSRKVVENLGTFSVSVYACALPGKGYMFELGDDEIELGLGIHGEPGIERTKLVSAKELVAVILPKLTKSKRLSLKKGEKIVVLLNNLGGVSQLELSIVQGEALKWFTTNGFVVERFISGSVMTSIDGYGLSFTILRVCDAKWLECLDASSSIAKHWNVTRPRASSFEIPAPRSSNAFNVNAMNEKGVRVSKEVAKRIEDCLRKACKVLTENEEHLNKLDAACGDGDCGSSLKSAAQTIEKSLKELDFEQPKVLLLQLADLFENSIGGTSGALYALLLGTASKCFHDACTSNEWKNGLKEGLGSIMYYGHAKPGYRTIVDALNAAVENKDKEWSDIVKIVEQAAKDTAKLEARSGRASYTSKDQQKQPDPGAIAVALWFRAIHDEYYKNA